MPVIIQSGAVNTNKAMVLWDNVLANSVLTTNHRTDPDYPAINAYDDPATWSSWKTIADDGEFRSDFGSSVQFSALGVSSHSMFSDGSTLRFYGTNAAGSYGAPKWEYTPTSDEDFIVLFEGMNFRYTIVRMTKPSSMGVVFLGNPLVFPHAPVDSYTPLHHARQYEKLYNDSIKGHFLGNRVMSAGAETEVDMGFLDRNWLENNISGFERHYNQGGTFFYSSSPARYPDDMGYCRSANSDESLAIEFIEGDRLSSLSFGVRSFVGA